jgi:hypothetical protein
MEAVRRSHSHHLSPALVEHPLYNHGRHDNAPSNPFCYNITILNTSIPIS